MGIGNTIHQFISRYYAFFFFFFGMFLLLMNLWIIQSPWLGIIGYVLYAIPVSFAIGLRFKKCGKYVSVLFGFLLMNSIFLASTAMLIRLCIPLSKWLLSIVLVLPMFFFLYYRYQTLRYALITQEVRIEESQNTFGSEDDERINPWLFHGFFLAIIAMIAALIFSSTDSTVSSLHKVLNPIYYVFNFIAITIVILVIFTKLNINKKLTFVLIYAIVSRLFRYLLYEVMTGSDMWRNLSGSIWFYDGCILTPHSSLYLTLASSENAYLGFWGLNVFISKITGISLYSLYPYVGILTAFFVTLILFQISRMLIHNERISLIVALLTSFLFDTFIWLSLSSANGLGFLMMLFALMVFILFIVNDCHSVAIALIVFLTGIFAYSLTAIYVVFLALITLSLIKRKRKLALILSFLFVTALPLIHFIGNFVEFLVSGTLPNIVFSPLYEVVIKMIFFSQRSGLNNILDIPYLLIYLLLTVGIIFGLRRVKSPIAFLLMTFLIAALVGDFYGWWLQIRIYHRIGSTIVSWLYIILAGIGIPIIYAFIKDNLPANHIIPVFGRINRVQTKKLLAIGLCLIFGFAATINLLYAPKTNSYNPSADLVEALQYISESDSNKNSLLLADAYSVIIFDAISRGKWYNLPNYGQSFHALELTIPNYLQVLRSPFSIWSEAVEGKEKLNAYLLSVLNETINIDNFYFVLDTVLIKHMYPNISPPSDIIEILSAYLGPPAIFGGVYLFSSPSPEMRWGDLISDNSGEGNNGIAYGPIKGMGLSGYCMAFDGKDDYIEAPALLLHNFTIEAWINFFDGEPSGHWAGLFNLFSNLDSLRILIKSDSLLVQMYAEGIVDNHVGYVSVIRNVWHHVAITYNQTNICIYFDNLLIYCNSQIGIIAEGVKTYIGWGSVLPDWYHFKGLIDELRVYNRTLAASEVSSSFLWKSPFEDNGLVLWYTFDE